MNYSVDSICSFLNVLQCMSDKLKLENEEDREFIKMNILIHHILSFFLLNCKINFKKIEIFVQKI